jgi:two-component system OmpR family response regulator
MNENNKSRRLFRILVADDDIVLLNTIIAYLDENGIQAVAASHPQQIVDDLSKNDPDLVILDLDQRRPDGFDLLRRFRAHSQIPIILTTDHQQDETDRVICLELGADDLMTKPIGMRELLARIRAILRRSADGREMPKSAPERGDYRFAGWLLDRRARRLRDPNGAPVFLTKGQYNLLVAFLDAPQRPLSREHLLQACYICEEVFDRTVDVQVLRLRRKLEAGPNRLRAIKTERGIGYTFTLPVELCLAPA